MQAQQTLVKQVYLKKTKCFHLPIMDCKLRNSFTYISLCKGAMERHLRDLALHVCHPLPPGGAQYLLVLGAQ